MNNLVIAISILLMAALFYHLELELCNNYGDCWNNDVKYAAEINYSDWSLK